MAAKMAAKTATDNEVLSEPEPPAPTDPRLPLNAREVFKLHKSWKGVKRNMDETGVEIMIRLFRNNHDIKLMFTAFSNLKDEELRDNEELEKHSLLVMGAFDDIMDNIENVDYVIKALEKLLRKHEAMKSFTKDLFWEMEKPFLDSVRLTLGDRYTDNMDAIYRTTIRFILETITKGAKPST